MNHPDVVTVSYYYPGGMQMPGRKYLAPNASKPRYGFNGKENDNEVKGEGNQQDYGMRIHDPRLVRFLSVDPLTKDFPELTPYQFASNSPIENIDLDGLESISAIKDAQARKFAMQTQLVLAKPKPREIEIMVWNPYRGQAQIGKASVVFENIAIARNNYNSGVASNIAGGPFGAASYMLNPAGGGFAGAAVDGIAMSFGGIPGGKSSVFPKSPTVSTVSTSATEIAPYEHSPVNIVHNAKPGWNKEQVTELYNKAQSISNNPESKVTIKNPMTRLANTKTNYLKQGGTLTKGQQVDHTTDLQINGNNGADGKTNLGGLNGSVNTSTGSQTYQQIKNLPDGTRVNHVLVNPFSH